MDTVKDQRVTEELYFDGEGNQSTEDYKLQRLNQQSLKWQDVSAWISRDRAKSEFTFAVNDSPDQIYRVLRIKTERNTAVMEWAR